MKIALISTALTLAASFANAGITGTVTTVTPDTGTPGGTFQHLGTPPAKVGNNNINVNDTIYAFDEKQSVAFGNAPTVDLGGIIGTKTLVSSYYVYFDPLRSQRIKASLTFSETILGIYTVKGTADYWTNHGSTFHSGTGLMGSQNDFGLTNANLYQYVNATGLEAADRSASHLSFSGKTLTLDWTASNPGDHIRVLTAVTAVPEPETYAMLLAGLGLMGTIARRRKAAQV